MFFKSFSNKNSKSQNQGPQWIWYHIMLSSIEVYFYGKEGYINLVGGLNTIAVQYTDGKM